MHEIIVRVARAAAREPLVRFVLLGAAVFGAHRLIAGPPRDRIEVTGETLAALRVEEARKGGAAGDGALVERWLDGELLYREALALGLDRGDIIVRRRLVQKMQLLLEGDEAPDAEETRRWFEAHQERYPVAATVSLEHRFYRDGAAAAARAAAGEAGDPFVRGARLDAVSREELAAVFGPELAGEVSRLEPGVWSAPLRSPYGLHVVRVLGRTGARSARFEEVEGRVREDFARARREERLREALAELRGRYGVRGLEAR